MPRQNEVIFPVEDFRQVVADSDASVLGSLPELPDRIQHRGIHKLIKLLPVGDNSVDVQRIKINGICRCAGDQAFQLSVCNVRAFGIHDFVPII